MSVVRFLLLGPTCRILAPATYIFFASVLPAVSFGEQVNFGQQQQVVSGTFSFSYTSTLQLFCRFPSLPLTEG